MKSLNSSILLSVIALNSSAAVLLDDTWADGTRTDQNLPIESAWYSSTGSALTTAVNSMTLAMPSGAVMAMSYFGTNSSSPVHLNVGDSLIASVTMMFDGVAPLNGSQGFRLGVYNFAESTLSPKWVTADGMGSGSQGAGVAGYTLFQNMGVTFNNSSPMDIRVRTNLTSSGLLSSTGDHKSLGTGPGNTNGFSGFANGVPYTLQLVLQRTNATGMLITATWINQSSGVSLSKTVADTNASNFNFDGIALRPSGAGSSATNIIFNEVKVELISGESSASIESSPVDQMVYTGQSATFTVSASGNPPLQYQWYYNTNTVLAGYTNASITITNAQLSDAGVYSAVVTNAYGSATSQVAQLTVTVPMSPSVTTQPQNQTVSPGQTAVFSVTASGSEPMNYQWYFNTNTLLANATDSILTITNAQLQDAGMYSVVINNLAGSTNSSFAMLTINTNALAPTFTVQPVSLVVVVGANATFSASASGSAPISYQWSRNGVPIPGAAGTTLSLTNVQNSNSGSYTVTASNAVGSAISDVVSLTVTASTPLPDSAYNLTGFAQSTTGGGIISETNSAYRKVYTALDLANALLSAYKTSGSVKVIEIMNDLDLGWNEIGSAVQTLASTPFRAHATPKLHPKLLVTGVSLIDIKPKSGLTIFSANGATIRHATFNIKSTSNVIVRNLKFDEMWEWDESSKGNYDGNDWDFIDLGNGGTVSNIWIDHCTFTKAYDGQMDIKGGSFNITVSWCRYLGDDGASNTNSFVRQQINFLEQSPASYPMYNFLRTHGFSLEDIVTICQGHDKTHLIGANSLSAENAQHSVTFHHDWFINPWDRLPRLRAGNVHNYNIYVDDTLGLAARRLRDARAAAMSSANQNTLNNTYNFRPFLNGSISTENGAVLVEKSVYKDCVTPLRNNQTDPSNPIYTGKIMALDTIYQFDSTVVRGNSTDSGNPLGPFQATIIPFSWNLPGNQLPYAYTMDDPSQLLDMLTVGAGAGVLTWNKTNWLMTSYPATAPTIIADPQSQAVSPGDTATFVVAASGSATLQYQWYFNTNSAIANATNSTLTLTNAQAGNAGVYSAIVTNIAGSATSAFAILTISSGAGFATWQSTNFTAQQLSDTNISGPNATPANDGVVNVVKYALGLAPFVPVTQPLVSIAYTNNEGVLTYHRPAWINDVVYVVESSTNVASSWSTSGITQQTSESDAEGRQIWQATYTGSSSMRRFFRLKLDY